MSEEIETLADRARRDGDTSDAAVARFRDLLRANPVSAEAALCLARCHAAREEWMNARATYELALNLRPNEAQRAEATKGVERAGVGEMEYLRTAAERERQEKLDRVARLTRKSNVSRQ